MVNVQAEEGGDGRECVGDVAGDDGERIVTNSGDEGPNYRVLERSSWR